MKDIEIRFSPVYAWMLIGFGSLFFLIGLTMTTPILPRQNIGAGVLMCIAASGGILAGRLWLKYLPVLLRLTEEELQLPKGQAVRWTDIATVDVKTLHVRRANVGFVCIKLKPGRGQAPESVSERVQKLFYRLLGDYDIVLNEETYSRPADWLAAEFNRRVAAIVVGHRDCSHP